MALPLMLGLCEIVLDRCHNITIASLWCLLEQPNKLTYLQCSQCKQLTKEDKDKIKDTIAEENLSLYFYLSLYIETEENLLAEGYDNLDGEDEEAEEESDA